MRIGMDDFHSCLVSSHILIPAPGKDRNALILQNPIPTLFCLVFNFNSDSSYKPNTSKDTAIPILIPIHSGSYSNSNCEPNTSLQATRMEPMLRKLHII